MSLISCDKAADVNFVGHFVKPHQHRSFVHYWLECSRPQPSGQLVGRLLWTSIVPNDIGIKATFPRQT